jgi:Multicopper oxidase
MYHCHILEHEDHDMMRPFVVMPAELMPFMDMHTAREDMPDRPHASPAEHGHLATGGALHSSTTRPPASA